MRFSQYKIFSGHERDEDIYKEYRVYLQKGIDPNTIREKIKEKYIDKIDDREYRMIVTLALIAVEWNFGIVSEESHKILDYYHEKYIDLLFESGWISKDIVYINNIIKQYEFCIELLQRQIKEVNPNPEPYKLKEFYEDTMLIGDLFSVPLGKITVSELKLNPSSKVYGIKIGEHIVSYGHVNPVVVYLDVITEDEKSVIENYYKYSFLFDKRDGSLIVDYYMIDKVRKKNVIKLLMNIKDTDFFKSIITTSGKYGTNDPYYRDFRLNQQNNIQIGYHSSSPSYSYKLDKHDVLKQIKELRQKPQDN